MFAFADAPVKVVALLVMFAFCTIWSTVELTRARSAVHRVNAVLHLVMSVVMLLMVVPATWMPLRSLVTLPGLVAIFALSTAWFVYRAVVSTPRHRLHAWGHAAMFGAMTWHVTGMFVRHQAMASMGDMHSSESMAGPSPAAIGIAVVGIPFMVYLLVSGLADLWKSVSPGQGPEAGHPEHSSTPDNADADDLAGHSAGSGAVGVDTLNVVEVVAAADAADPTGDLHTHADEACAPEHTTGSRSSRLAALSAAAMNLGMFWMSTGLMLPIAHWLDVLTF